MPASHRREALPVSWQPSRIDVKNRGAAMIAPLQPETKNRKQRATAIVRARRAVAHALLPARRETSDRVGHVAAWKWWLFAIWCVAVCGATLWF